MAQARRSTRRAASGLGLVAALALSAATLLLASAAAHAAFAALPSSGRPARTALRAAAAEGDAALERRAALLLGGGSLWSVTLANPENAAADVKSIVVAGATGQTGRRIVERLGAKGGVSVVAGVRDIAKGEKELKSSSVTIRGAMVEQVSAVDTKGVSLKKLDVVKDSVDAMAATLQGADALVVATGFVPGNPFAMNQEAHAVDNLGTIALVDAAKKAGVSKVVLVSSILTNGRAWGQESSPGFTITNAFGGVLDEKIVAEKYLRASGLDYTIVRPGGLKASAPSGNVVFSAEDTLNNGEVSRDTVADVCVAALFNPKSSNKVVEIIEDESAPKLEPGQWFA